jgi:hypothetical protein
MKKLIVSIFAAVLAAAITLPVTAQDAKPADKGKPEEKKPAAAAARAVPFRGKLDAVDQQAKTIKVGERTFHVTSDTRIMKAGKPATLAEVKVGEEVGGAYREGDDKKLNVVSLRVGPRPQQGAPTKPDDKK